MDVLTANTHMVIRLFLLLILGTNLAFAVEGESVSTLEGNQSSDVKTRALSASLDYLTWQNDGEIKSSSGSASSSTVVTNSGFCAGGSYGYRTTKYRAYVDGCFIFGEGKVSAVKNNVTYNQKNVSLWGLKAAPGISRIVSSKKVELGFKIPIMYVNQNFNQPSGSNLTEPNDFLIMASLYSRWPFGDWFFQTEFSKIVGNDHTLLSLGGGYNF